MFPSIVRSHGRVYFLFFFVEKDIFNIERYYEFCLFVTIYFVCKIKLWTLVCFQLEKLWLFDRTLNIFMGESIYISKSIFECACVWTLCYYQGTNFTKIVNIDRELNYNLFVIHFRSLRVGSRRHFICKVSNCFFLYICIKYFFDYLKRVSFVFFSPMTSVKCDCMSFKGHQAFVENVIM